MTFAQVYYTSCISGLSGTKGFQINAATPGLSEAVLQEVARAGLYEAPSSASTRPTSEELLRFPLALTYRRLGDDRPLVIQSLYVGADYSGRQGNYFAHSLIGDSDEAFHDLLPIELWKSPSWTTQASSNVALEALAEPARGSMGPHRIGEILRDPAQAERLVQFLTAVEEALRSNRRILLVVPPDASSEIAKWICIASYCLPRSLALKLTFTTYSKKPYNTDTLITGMTPDADFGFAAHEVQHQFSVFDFVGQRSSPALPPSVTAQAFAGAYLAGNAKNLAAFGRFADRLAPQLTLAEVAPAYRTFAILGDLEPPATDLTEACSWAATHGDRLDPVERATVFDALIAVPVSSERTVTAVASLYGKAPDASHEELDPKFAGWLFTNALRTAEPAWLDRLAKEFAPGPSLVKAAQARRQDWVNTLRQESNEVRWKAGVRLGERFELLGEGAPMEEIGEALIGPALAHESGRGLFQRLVSGERAPDVVRGVSRYLCELPAASGVIPSLALLKNEELLILLQNEALLKGQVGVFARLTGVSAAASAERRLLALRRCVAVVKSPKASLNADNVDMITRALWGEANPTLAEGTGILDFLKGALAGTMLSERLWKTVAAGLDLKQSDPAREKLAGALKAAGLTEQLDERVALCDVIQLAANARQRPDAETLCKLLHLRQRSAAGVPGAIVELVTEKMMRLSEPAQVQVLDAARPDDSEFYAAYGEVVQQGLSPEALSGVQVQFFVTCWKVWGRARQSPALAAFQQESLPSYVRDWPPRSFDAMFEELPTWTGFNAWRSRYFPPKGFLNRLFGRPAPPDPAEADPKAGKAAPWSGQDGKNPGVASDPKQGKPG